jgi:hypothetical protein
MLEATATSEVGTPAPATGRAPGSGAPARAGGLATLRGPVGTRSATAAVVAFAAAGVAARAWVLSGPLGRATSDDAVVGLMARAALDGDLTIFFWGQAYGGSQESLLAAALFAVAGPSTLALKLVPVALYGVASLLLWRIGIRAVGEPAARVAAALPFVLPAGFVWWTTQARGFYAATMVCGLALVLLAQRIAATPGPAPARDAAFYGLAAGLGAWASPQIALFALPVTLWLAARHPRALRSAGWVAAGAVVGAAPWLYDLVAHRRSPLGDVVRVDGIGLADRARVFAEGLPQTLGLQAPFSHDWLLPGGKVVGPAIAAAAAVAVVAAPWPLRRSPRRDALEPVLAVAIAYPLLFALSPFSLSPDAVRYFSYLVPCVALGLGWLLTRHGAALAAGTFVCILLLASGLAGIDAYSRRPACWEEVRPPDLGPLVAELDARGIDALVAEYWLAYRVTFETGGRIVATPNDRIRHLPSYRAVADAGFTAYAFLANAGPEERVFVDLARDRGVDIERVRAGDVRLYLLGAELEPREVTYVPATLLSDQCMAT